MKSLAFCTYPGKTIHINVKFGLTIEIHAYMATFIYIATLNERFTRTMILNSITKSGG